MLTTTATTARTDTVFRNYVDGEWTSLDGARFVERRNPANTNDVVGHVPLATKHHVEAAVEAADRARERWRGTPAPVRGRLLLDASRLLEARADEIAAVITREQGKTLAEAHGEVDLAVKVLEYVAGDGRRLSGETLPSEQRGRFAYTVRHPIGVVGLITPWNFPLGVPMWKIAPALVCGNTIVWKPSRLTPMTSECVVQLFADAGLPFGVLNLVHGAGVEAGGALIAHARVRGISFTSSFEVGTKIYEQAARLFKKVQCEAGGKNAVIVMPDADLLSAAEAIHTGAFRYAGQRCTATSRVVAVGGVGDELVELLKRRAEAMVVGDGSHPDTEMGPVADEYQLTRVLRFIHDGMSQGRLVYGGGRLDGPSYERGLFVQPTIFDHVRPNSDLAREEIFGPVLSVMRVETLADAIACANDNRYGMATAIFTDRLSVCLEAAERLDCGIVHINGATIGAEPHVPFGGIKDTGVGDRELGTAAQNFYTELKAVYVRGA